MIIEDSEADEIVYKGVEDCLVAEKGELGGRESESTLADREILFTGTSNILWHPKGGG